MKQGCLKPAITKAERDCREEGAAEAIQRSRRRRKGKTEKNPGVLGGSILKNGVGVGGDRGRQNCGTDPNQRQGGGEGGMKNRLELR